MVFEESKKTKEIRGLILSDVAMIELMLTMRIIKTFSKNNKKYRSMLYKYVFDESFTFSKKIRLLQKLPNFKKLKESKKILDYLNGIRIDRNIVAHSTTKKVKGGVIFEGRLEGKDLFIDDNYIKKFENKILYLSENL